ncbi:hypothetical protein HYC85_016942 [Camellia sinensis]|uniref:RNase H type-1 domain-containing protein n=1 Tax=Camellia sinensis TaxID=4442 RepID=A0A7J7H4D9_CAMSI|nr:hypothetical protein HYC85_016942 [Camellia sinensis]
MGTFLINGSWRSNGLIAGAAWVCLNDDNQQIAQRAMAIQCLSSPLMAEATPCLEAMK